MLTRIWKVLACPDRMLIVQVRHQWRIIVHNQLTQLHMGKGHLKSVYLLYLLVYNLSGTDSSSSSNFLPPAHSEAGTVFSSVHLCVCLCLSMWQHLISPITGTVFSSVHLCVCLCLSMWQHLISPITVRGIISWLKDGQVWKWLYRGAQAVI